MRKLSFVPRKRRYFVATGLPSTLTTMGARRLILKMLYSTSTTCSSLERRTPTTLWVFVLEISSACHSVNREIASSGRELTRAAASALSPAATTTPLKHWASAWAARHFSALLDTPLLSSSLSLDKASYAARASPSCWPSSRRANSCTAPSRTQDRKSL